MTSTARPPDYDPLHRREEYRGQHYFRGQHYPDQPPRSSRVPLAVGAGVLALAGVVAAIVLTGDPEGPARRPGVPQGAPSAAPSGSASEPGAPASPAPAASPPPDATPAPSPAAGPGSPAGPPPPTLGDRFLTAPAGFQPVDDASAGTGPLDAAGAAAADGAGGVTPAQLTALGLEAAHSRTWRSRAGALVVLAYDFADTDGARGFVARAADPANVRPGAVRLALAGPPGVRAYQMEAAGQPLQVALFARADRAYVVGLRGRVAGDAASDRLQELATAQAEVG